MKIVRDGKEYELTPEELAEELAEKAYDRYCEGNGETEGECIDWAYYSWLESTRED